MLAYADKEDSPAIIKVVGVGGAGGNAIERMVNLHLDGVELIVMNTDEQVLRKSTAHTKVHIGTKNTRGMGAGAKPEVGAQAALEDKDKIQNVLKGADMVFITAGMGGGTGTGASPIVAEVAKSIGALTVGVVSLPFSFEGKLKMDAAKQGLANLRDKVDTLITISNDSIFKVIDRNTPVNMAFKAIDDILAKSVIGISQIINSTGYVNVDFADVRTVMSENGDAIIGVGEGYGDNKVADALANAITHPLLEGKNIDGANAVLINIVGGSDLTMHEYADIQKTIYEIVSKAAQIIVGFTEDAAKDDQVSVTVIATGFKKVKQQPENVFDSQQQPFVYKKAVNDNGYYGDSPSYEPPPLRVIEQDKNEILPSRQNTQGFSFAKNNPATQNHTQPGLNFPNIDHELQNLNIPTFMRKKKDTM